MKKEKESHVVRLTIDGIEYDCHPVIESLESSPTKKVGDTVKIREDLKEGVFYGMDNSDRDIYFSYNMVEFKGMSAIIVDARFGFYTINIDNEVYCWSDEMFE